VTTLLAHGDVVPIDDLPSAWRLDPLLLALATVGILLFAQAFWRLRSRGRDDLAGWDRLGLFALAVSVLLLALASPLDAAGDEYLLSAHMLQHVLVADLVPALLIVAVRGPLVFFLLPQPALRVVARPRWLRTALGSLVRPGVALALWALVIAAWHVPTVYDYTLTHRAVHDLEHASFLLVGLLVWNLLVDPARHGVLSVPARLGVALVLFAAGQILANVLIFSTSPLYPVYAAQDERLFGLSPLTDQKLAGVVMMGEQLLTLGTCAALLLLGERRPRRRARLA
jgi:putative membrane protein